MEAQQRDTHAYVSRQFGTRRAQLFISPTFLRGSHLESPKVIPRPLYRRINFRILMYLCISTDLYL